MKQPFIAVLHNGTYENDQVLFDPLLDHVPYADGDTLPELLAKYENPKATLVQGAFICPQLALRTVCGDRPVLEWKSGAAAIRQNRHQLQALASFAWMHLGVLPGACLLEAVAIPSQLRHTQLRELEAAADRIADTMTKHKKARNR